MVVIYLPIYHPFQREVQVIYLAMSVSSVFWMHFLAKRNSKLTKSESAEPNCRKGGIISKKEMLSEIKLMDKEYQQTMARFASALENLSHSVSRTFGMMGTFLQRTQPSYCQPQMSHYVAQCQPSKEKDYCQTRAVICLMLAMMILAFVRCFAKDKIFIKLCQCFRIDCRVQKQEPCWYKIDLLKN